MVMVTIGNCEQDFVILCPLISAVVQDLGEILSDQIRPMCVDLREKKLTPPSKVSFTVSVLMLGDVGKLRPVAIGENIFRAFLLRFVRSSPK